MDSARQILRFSIPGSVTLFSLTAFLVLVRIFNEDELGVVVGSIQENISAVAVIFAAVPLGFLIYQIYYYSTYRSYVWPWAWPLPAKRRWVRIDRGAQILNGLNPAQRQRIKQTFNVSLDLNHALDKSSSLLGRLSHAYKLNPEFIKNATGDPHDEYRRRRQKNWNVIRALIELSQSTSLGSTIKSEYTVLSDFYHALGACRTGIQIAWFVSIAASAGHLFVNHNFLGFLLSTGTTSVLAAAVFWVFHQTRGSAWASAQASMTLSLTALFKLMPDFLLAPENQGDP